MTRYIERLCQFGGCLLLCALVVMIAAELVVRNIFGFSLLVSDEYAGYMTAMIALLGVPFATSRDALLRVDFIRDNLRGVLANITKIVFLLIAIAVSLVVLHQIARMALRSFRFNIMAATPSMTPLWIPQGVMAFGALLLLLVLLAQLVVTIRTGLGSERGEHHV